MKPNDLHVIEGTFRPDRHGQKDDQIKADGRPIPPARLTKRRRELWDDYIGRAPWLSEADSHALYIYVGLCAEAERSIEKFNASRIAQFRMLGQSLGLDPIGRSRMAAKPKRATDAKAKKTDPASRYF